MTATISMMRIRPKSTRSDLCFVRKFCMGIACIVTKDFPYRKHSRTETKFFFVILNEMKNPDEILRYAKSDLATLRMTGVVSF